MLLHLIYRKLLSTTSIGNANQIEDITNFKNDEFCENWYDGKGRGIEESFSPTGDN